MNFNEITFTFWHMAGIAVFAVIVGFISGVRTKRDIIIDHLKKTGVINDTEK